MNSRNTQTFKFENKLRSGIASGSDRTSSGNSKCRCLGGFTSFGRSKNGNVQADIISPFLCLMASFGVITRPENIGFDTCAGKSTSKSKPNILDTFLISNNSKFEQGKCHSCVAKTASISTITKVSTPSDPEGRWVRGSKGSERQRFPDSGHNVTPPQRASPRQTEPGGKGIELSRRSSSSSVREKDQEMTAPKGTVGRRKPVVAPAEAIPSTVAVPNNIAILGDLQKAFAYFRERHPGGTALEENKTLLGEKYARAKVGRGIETMQHPYWSSQCAPHLYFSP